MEDPAITDEELKERISELTYEVDELLRKATRQLAMHPHPGPDPVELRMYRERKRELEQLQRLQQARRL